MRTENPLRTDPGKEMPMNNTAMLAMIALTPQEEARLTADLAQMTAFGERLSQFEEESGDE